MLEIIAAAGLRWGMGFAPTYVILDVVGYPMEFLEGAGRSLALLCPLGIGSLVKVTIDAVARGRCGRLFLERLIAGILVANLAVILVCGAFLLVVWLAVPAPDSDAGPIVVARFGALTNVLGGLFSYAVLFLPTIICARLLYPSCPNKQPPSGDSVAGN